MRVFNIPRSACGLNPRQLTVLARVTSFPPLFHALDAVCCACSAQLYKLHKQTALSLVPPSATWPFRAGLQQDGPGPGGPSAVSASCLFMHVFARKHRWGDASKPQTHCRPQISECCCLHAAPPFCQARLRRIRWTSRWNRIADRKQRASLSSGGSRRTPRNAAPFGFFLLFGPLRHVDRRHKCRAAPVARIVAGHLAEQTEGEDGPSIKAGRSPLEAPRARLWLSRSPVAGGWPLAERMHFMRSSLCVVRSDVDALANADMSKAGTGFRREGRGVTSEAARRGRLVGKISRVARVG